MSTQAARVDYHYLPLGVVNVTNPLGAVDGYFIDSLNGMARQDVQTRTCADCAQNSGGGSLITHYDANGNFASVIDYLANKSTYLYDLVCNLEISRTEMAGTTVARTISTAWHPTLRLPVQIAEPRRITRSTYDAQGNPTSQTIQATSDDTGALGFDAVSSGIARTWTFTNTYSSSIPGLLVQQVIDGPRTDVADLTTLRWDESGNLTSVINALGHIISLRNYDANGRPQQIVDPNGLETNLFYDARGRLLSINVGGELTVYRYDGVGQLTQTRAPVGSSLTYTYDAAHRLIRVSDNLNNQIVYTLDAMGNRVQEQVLDPNNSLVRTRTRVYDGLGRLFREIGGANPSGQITTYFYDSMGNVTSIFDPLGNTTTLTHYELSRLTRVTDPVLAGASLRQLCLTRCLILVPPVRRQTRLDRSETISPWKWPFSLRPRKFITSLAPKHNVLWLSSCGYSSHRFWRLLNKTSVEYSLWALTQ